MVAIALGGLLLAACAGSRMDSPLPDAIHGLDLVSSEMGDDAAATITGLHQQDVGEAESFVGRYEGGGFTATLYVSRFASADDATRQLATMAEAIGSSASGFGHHRSFAVSGTDVHSVFGHGQIHFFYVAGSDLTWLGVHPMLARQSLAELLGVSADSIPNLMPAVPDRAGGSSNTRA